MVGIPGSNPSGVQTQVPGPVNSGNTATLGGTTNPVGAPVPTGTSMPGASNPLAALMQLNPAGPGAIAGNNSQGGNIAGLSTNSIVEALRKAGYSSGIGYLLANFLEGGAGFNPQVAQALLAALGPSIQQGQANILEQFGSQGLRESSPAAYGMASFDAQATLAEGQILSQMYEQAVQNYMDVLLAGKKGAQPTLSGIGSVIGGAGQLASGVGSLIPKGGSGS